MISLDKEKPKVGDLVVLGFAKEYHDPLYMLTEINNYILECLTGEGTYDPEYSCATHFQKVDEISIASPKQRISCQECGSQALEWQWAGVNRGDIADGRLRMHDISFEFSLGCITCSETMLTLTAEQVCQKLNNLYDLRLGE